MRGVNLSSRLVSSLASFLFFEMAEWERGQSGSDGAMLYAGSKMQRG